MPKPSKIWTSSLVLFKRITLISALSGLLAIALIWYGIILLAQNEAENNYFGNVQNGEVAAYSLEGKVLKVAGAELELEVGQVVQTGNGNELRFKTYTVKFSAGTQIIVSGQNTTDNPLAEIVTGRNITVYTAENPFDTATITAAKIEVN